MSGAGAVDDAAEEARPRPPAAKKSRTAVGGSWEEGVRAIVTFFKNVRTATANLCLDLEADRFRAERNRGTVWTEFLTELDKLEEAYENQVFLGDNAWLSILEKRLELTLKIIVLCARCIACFADGSSVICMRPDSVPVMRTAADTKAYFENRIYSGINWADVVRLKADLESKQSCCKIPIFGPANVMGMYIRAPHVKRFRGRVFDPVTFCDPQRKPQIMRDDFNMYRGVAMAPFLRVVENVGKGRYRDVIPLINMIRYGCCDSVAEFRYIISWMANAMLDPSNRPTTCLVLVGIPGQGKTNLFKALRAVLGEDVCLHITRDADLTTQFNKVWEGKLLICIDDVDMSLMKKEMKNRITDNRLAIEGKGENMYITDFWGRFIFCTNEPHLIPMGDHQRRINMFNVNMQGLMIPWLELGNVEPTTDAIDMIREEFGKQMNLYYTGPGKVVLASFLAAWSQDPDLMSKDLNRVLNTPTNRYWSYRQEAQHNPVYKFLSGIVAQGHWWPRGSMRETWPFQGEWVDLNDVHVYFDQKHKREYDRMDLTAFADKVQEVAGRLILARDGARVRVAELPTWQEYFKGMYDASDVLNSDGRRRAAVVRDLGDLSMGTFETKSPFMDEIRGMRPVFRDYEDKLATEYRGDLDAQYVSYSTFRDQQLNE